MEHSEYDRHMRNAKVLRFAGMVLLIGLMAVGLVLAVNSGRLLIARPQGSVITSQNRSIANSWNTLVVLDSLQTFVPFALLGILAGMVLRKLAKGQEAKANEVLAEVRRAAREKS